MCGIVGYVGFRPAANVIVDGLQKLEYRGYDSFGVATNNPCLEVYKCEGKISEKGERAWKLHGTIGIGHTRWATHGVPSDRNAHPHLDCTGKIAVVHNGIIENYAALTRELTARGHVFRSETDTEVVAHLIEESYDGSDLRGAVEQAITRLKGSYALLVTVEGRAEVVAARDSSPLVLGIGDLEVFAASDVTPLLGYTERVVYLEDGDLAEIDREGWRIYSRGNPVRRPVEHVDWDVETVKKGGFPHFMLKEIFEQPKVFYDTLHGVTEASLPERYRRPSEITVVACGSSYHAGLVFKYLCESTCRIPVRAELGSEFKYFTPPLKGIVTVITQSGETADTLAALKKARAYNCPTLAITNVLGSTVTRIADHTVYMRAGPEISVAATKSFIAQLAVLMGLVDLMKGGNRFGAALERANSVIEEVLLLDIEKSGRDLPAGRAPLLRRSRPLLPDRARGGAQDEGDLVHPRRGLRGRRAQARAVRAPLERDAGRRALPARRHLLDHALEHQGDEGEERADHRDRRTRGPGADRHRRRLPADPREPRAASSWSRPRSCSSSSPTRPRSRSGATWTSPETSPRA